MRTASIQVKYGYLVGQVPDGSHKGVSSTDLVPEMASEDLFLYQEVVLSLLSVPPAETTVLFSDFKASLGRR